MTLIRRVHDLLVENKYTIYDHAKGGMPTPPKVIIAEGSGRMTRALQQNDTVTVTVMIDYQTGLEGQLRLADYREEIVNVLSTIRNGNVVGWSESRQMKLGEPQGATNQRRKTATYLACIITLHARRDNA